MSLLDQANNPRRLVAHDDASVVHSCTYPCATLLGGIRWWIQCDRLSHPLHSLEGQSRPWGVCITPASGGEELHLYSSQVIKDLHGLDPSSLTGAVISRERLAASWCAQLSWALTTMPHPTPVRPSGISLGSRLPTLHCPSHASQGSRVHSRGLKQNAVGGVLLNAPSPLWGSPVFLQGRVRLTWSPIHSHPMEEAWVPAFRTTHCRLDRLTSQARYVRGHFSRRAMHASGDSP
jgi:hypothetical protein